MSLSPHQTHKYNPHDVAFLFQFIHNDMSLIVKIVGSL